jgi:hypothetical protein
VANRQSLRRSRTRAARDDADVGTLRPSLGPGSSSKDCSIDFLFPFSFFLDGVIVWAVVARADEKGKKKGKKERIRLLSKKDARVSIWCFFLGALFFQALADQEGHNKGWEHARARSIRPFVAVLSSPPKPREQKKAGSTAFLRSAGKARKESAACVAQDGTAHKAEKKKTAPRRNNARRCQRRKKEKVGRRQEKGGRETSRQPHEALLPPQHPDLARLRPWCASLFSAGSPSPKIPPTDRAKETGAANADTAHEREIAAKDPPPSWLADQIKLASRLDICCHILFLFFDWIVERINSECTKSINMPSASIHFLLYRSRRHSTAAIVRYLFALPFLVSVFSSPWLHRQPTLFTRHAKTERPPIRGLVDRETRWNKRRSRPCA